MNFDEQHTKSVVPLFRTMQAVTALRSATGVLYPLLGNANRWTLGSHAACDLVIEDRCVSGYHCVLERVPGGELVVRDRGSRNGTFLDGHSIEGALLAAGSRLLVGKTTLLAIGDERGPARSAWESLRGNHPAFRKALDCAEKAAASDCNVLIIGETGTGKDLVARAIHERSRRTGAPFVAVNCGAIPRELVASELFGHERGAFTGASTDRDGYFVQADGGTLFLDELGELPLELQPHLLRALEARLVRRVGGATERAIDVRVIAATHRVDGLGTDSSRLRLDLFHRVAALMIAMPPLRERLSDIQAMVTYFLDELGHGARRVLSEAAWEALISYDWPGNARELRHAVARAVAMGEGILQPGDFFPELDPASPPLRVRRIAQNGLPLATYETPIYEQMVRALSAHTSLRAAAASIGMPKSTFVDRAHHWGLALPRARRAASG